MLEFEKKVMLLREEYDFLKNHRYATAKNNMQVNYYYDTDDFELNRNGISCRIREKNGICTATIKQHRIKGTDCSVENSQIVKNRFDDSLFLNMGLFRQGSLYTIRNTYSPQTGILVMLDCNHYLDISDYELEIEYDKNSEHLANAELEEIISTLKEGKILENMVDFRNRINQAKSKSTRFFSRKTELITQQKGDYHEIYYK